MSKENLKVSKPMAENPLLPAVEIEKEGRVYKLKYCIGCCDTWYYEQNKRKCPTCGSKMLNIHVGRYVIDDDVVTVVNGR